MINYLCVINKNEKKHFYIEFHKKTLIFSSKNSHGKTFLINFLLWSLNQDTNFKKNDNINLNDYISILSIKDTILIRTKDSFYYINDNKLNKVIKKEYNRKISFILGLEKLPFIRKKDNSYTNEYLNSFFTFFYINPDCSGDNSKQLKCEMYGKKNLDNYFYFLWNSNDEILSNNRKLSQIINEDTDIKDKQLKIKIYKKILSKINTNLCNQIPILNDDEILELKNKIKKQYDIYYSLLGKIDELNIQNTNYLNAINPLEKIDEELDKTTTKYYINIPNNNGYNEIEIELKLSDFFKEYKSSKIIEVSRIKNNIEINKIEIKELESELSEILLDINKLKSQLNNCLNKSDLIEPLGDYLIYDLLEIKQDDIVKILDKECQDKNEIDDLEKNINKFIKEQSLIFDNEMKEFENKHNFIGATNSKKFKYQLLKYELLSNIHKEMFLIIDAYDSLGFDENKFINLIEKENNINQKIITLTASNDDIKNFKNNGYNIVDISNDRYNMKIINEDILNLKSQNENLYNILLSEGFINEK